MSFLKQQTEMESEACVWIQLFKSPVNEAAQLKDSSARHLLWKLFTLYAGTRVSHTCTRDYMQHNQTIQMHFTAHCATTTVAVFY